MIDCMLSSDDGGMLIPQSNRRHLMLDRAVVEAIPSEEFPFAGFYKEINILGKHLVYSS